MEEAQESHSGTGSGDARRLMGGTGGGRLTLRYIPYSQLSEQPESITGNLLGAIAFGAQPPARIPACPYAWVDMPVLNGAGVFEIWESDEGVVRIDGDGVLAARDGGILFGCVQLNEADHLDVAAHLAYCRIFDFIDGHGYPHLLRAWNYFPRINAEAHGLERYRTFNIGRHQAFAARGRATGTDAPAACALGALSGPFTVYFIAARQPGLPVENPRQTSAYHYPLQYGPRSPTFSRAMLMRSARDPILFMSGTSSVVGHETLHAGDAVGQINETVANIKALLEQAGSGGGENARVDRKNLLLKAYLRHPSDLSVVEECLARTFGQRAHAVYLQADICRSDLLVEVEGACLAKSL